MDRLAPSARNLAAALPESEWLYLLLTAAVFVFVGLVVGYLIWRKAAVQAEDAAAELLRSAQEYEKIKAVVEREERALAEPE
jgi:hypothetical protein